MEGNRPGTGAPGHSRKSDGREEISTTTKTVLSSSPHIFFPRSKFDKMQAYQLLQWSLVEESAFGWKETDREHVRLVTE
jgi:hypothetical protein